jgi:GalNAc5-diNAcBac-PP-undecaprenol beta-1,3-glucosyltransferase
MKHPKVTIVMATYNRAHLIAAALESVIVQSYENWECIIIDDGSTDNTSEVVADFLNKDARFRYYSRSHNFIKGIPGCRNYGLKLAKGELIIFFDDDDVVHPQNIEFCVKVFEDYRPDFCFYQKQPFFDDIIPTIKHQEIEIGKWVSSRDIEPILKNTIPLASCTVMWAKSCFNEDKFNEHLMYAEEWECYSRIISNGKIGLSINNILYFNRKHSNSNTGEFWNGSDLRTKSKKTAILLVLQNLNNKNLLTPGLTKYFIRLGFSLNNMTIIYKTLNYSGAGPIKKIKYIVGYHIYPLLKPFFSFNKIFKKY